MLLLWLNTITAAIAAGIWVLITHHYAHDRKPRMAIAYGIAAAAASMMVVGFARVLIGGDPTVSAILARQWAWVAIGIPAFARLCELLHGDVIRLRVARSLTRAELRADLRDIRADFRDTRGDLRDSRADLRDNRADLRNHRDSLRDPPADPCGKNTDGPPA